MQVRAIEARALHIAFRAAFRHAAASRAMTQSVIVTARMRDGATGHGEGCPRAYVTGESVEGALRFIAGNAPEWCQAIDGVASLRAWVGAHRSLIDANPAAWTAVELALLDAFGAATGQPIEALLDEPPLTGRFAYSAVVGDAPPPEFESTLRRYIASGFTGFKVKLAGHHDRDADKACVLLANGVAPDRVRADANNVWTDAATALRALTQLPLRFAAYEEPLRAGDMHGMRALAAALDRPVVLDESACRVDQIAALVDDPARWIVNVRVSKMGGLLRSLDVVRAAKRYGVRMVVGAHVGETSLLTRAGLTVAKAAGDALFGHEGAFGTHLLAHDVTDAPLMFGGAGVLDTTALRLADRAGLGVAVSAFRDDDGAPGAPGE
jgi:L-alanine-DL-glutamate epimerase-like enolase superfamily enzyme